MSEVKDKADAHAWVKKFTGIDPAQPRTPPADVAPPSGSPQASPGGLPPPGSDQQAQEFHAALQQRLATIDGHLAYTTEHAETAKHQPLAARRDSVAGAYQPAAAQVDPGDPAKAKDAIGKVLADADALAKDAAAFRQAAEKAFDDWQTRQPRYDEAVKQAGEMQSWGHAKAPPLQSSLDGIRLHLDGRAYAEACTAFDQAEPQVKPAYEDYQKQKAAQEQYEPARKELDPRLSAASTSEFKKLEAAQQAFGPAVTEMDAAAAAKDFVRALQLETELAAKVGEYERALAELKERKQAYDAEKTAVQPKLDQAGQAPEFKKLATSKQDLAASQQAMESAAQSEEYDQALAMAKELGTKADALNQAATETAEQKKAYEDAAAKAAPRPSEQSPSKAKEVASAQADAAAGRKAMEAAAADEDYAAAATEATGLVGKLDSLDAAVKKVEETKARYEKARDDLKAGLSGVGNPPRPPLQADEQAITGMAKSMQAAEAGEDFDTALRTAEELRPKVEAYVQAAAKLDDAPGATWTPPFELPACSRTADATTNLADIRAKTDEWDSAGYNAEVKLVRDAVDKQLGLLSGADRPLTEEEAQTLTALGLLAAKALEDAVKQLVDAISAELDKYSGFEAQAAADHVAELIHQEFRTGDGSNRIADLKEIVGKFQGLVGNLKDYVGYAAKTKSVVKAAAKLDEVTKAIDGFKGKLGTAGTALGLASDVATLAGKVAQKPSEGANDIATLRAGLNIADFVISKSNVPLIGQWWTYYIKPCAEIAMKQLQKLDDMIDRSTRDLQAQEWWEHASKGMQAPSIEASGLEGVQLAKTFPGGQAMLDFMWSFFRGNPPSSAPKGVVQQFAKFRKQYNAGLPEDEQLKSDAAWTNLWTSDELPNLMQWVAKNKEYVWAAQYGSLPHP